MSAMIGWLVLSANLIFGRPPALAAGDPLVPADYTGHIAHSSKDIQPGWPRHTTPKEDAGLVAGRSAGIGEFYRDAYLNMWANEWLKWSTDGDGGVKKLTEIATTPSKSSGDYQQTFRYAAHALYLGKRLNDPRLLDLGQRLYEILSDGLLNTESQQIQVSFSKSQGCFFATWSGALLLHREGRLSGKLRDNLRKLAYLRVENCRPEWILQRASHNHAIKPIISYTVIAQLFPDDPRLARMRRHLAQYWNIMLDQWQDWVEISHYGEWSLFQFTNGVRLAGKLARLKKPELAQHFPPLARLHFAKRTQDLERAGRRIRRLDQPGLHARARGRSPR